MSLRLSPAIVAHDLSLLAVYKRGTTQCGPEVPHSLQQRIHSGINSLVNLYLPLGVMVFCYFRIFQEIRAHLGRSVDPPAGQRSGAAPNVSC